MINLMSAIPEHIGWVLVGAVGMLALEIVGLVIGTVVDMVRDRLQDDEDFDECETF